MGIELGLCASVTSRKVDASMLNEYLGRAPANPEDVHPLWECWPQAPTVDERFLFENPYSMFERAQSGYLWHYTTMVGLVGIFSSRSVWATEARFLNDAGEIKWAAGLLRKEIRSQVGGLSLPETDPANRLLDRGLQTELFFENQGAVFIASFSANPDSIQMWQAYGRGGGFALGFESTRLREAGLAKGFSLVKCIYPLEDNDPKIATWIERSIELLRTLELREAEPQIIVSGQKLLASIKHSAFSHEDEWRLVRPWSGGPSDYAVEPSVRGGLGTPVPFVSLELMSESARERVRRLIETGVPALRDTGIRNQHADWVLWPISRVVIGPTHQRDQALLSIRLVCQEMSGPEIPRVVSSSTPLQANP